MYSVVCHFRWGSSLFQATIMCMNNNFCLQSSLEFNCCENKPNCTNSKNMIIVIIKQSIKWITQSCSTRALYMNVVKALCITITKTASTFCMYKCFSAFHTYCYNWFIEGISSISNEPSLPGQSYSHCVEFSSSQVTVTEVVRL